jgi:thiol-disulfide isomerase/thioredoxin
MELRRAAVCLASALALASGVGGEARAERRPAPNCALVSLADARPRELREFRGQVLWVDFWASWCGSCKTAFPFLDDLEHEFGARGFRVVGINVDELRADATDFLREHPVAFEQLADQSGACPREFRVLGMPSSYLIDREGVIRREHRGFRPRDAAELRAAVEALLAETAPSPE